MKEGVKRYQNVYHAVSFQKRKVKVKNEKIQNILVLTSWSYKDALIQTYTLPYIKIISKNIGDNSRIFLVTYEHKNIRINKNELPIINNDLIKIKTKLLQFSFYKFGLTATLYKPYELLYLIFLCITRKITHIHVWCTPAAVFGYILSKMFNVSLIIDSYEPHAEPSVENGTWKPNGFAFKFLFFFERLVAKRLDVAIATSTYMFEYVKNKFNAELKNKYVKPALVDINKFTLDKKKNKELIYKYGFDNKIVCVFAGKLGGIYLKQEVFDFFSIAIKYWGKEFRVLLLTSNPRDEIEQLSQNSNINPDYIISKFVSHSEIPKYIGLGDFGINPVKPIPAKKSATSIKDGEYWAMGLPVIITNSLKDDVDIINKHDIGYVLQDLTEEEYIRAIKKIDYLIKENNSEKLAQKIRNIANTYRRLEIAEDIYSQIYSKLV